MLKQQLLLATTKENAESAATVQSNMLLFTDALHDVYRSGDPIRSHFIRNLNSNLKKIFEDKKQNVGCLNANVMH